MLFVHFEIILYFYYGIFGSFWNLPGVSMCVTVLSARINHTNVTCRVLFCSYGVSIRCYLLYADLPLSPFSVYSTWCDARRRNHQCLFFLPVETGCDCECLPSEHCAVCRLTSPATVQCIRLVTILTALCRLTRQHIKQGRECTCNVTLRIVRGTIVAVEKQYVLHILNVCL